MLGALPPLRTKS